MTKAPHCHIASGLTVCIECYRVVGTLSPAIEGIERITPARLRAKTRNAILETTPFATLPTIASHFSLPGLSQMSLSDCCPGIGKPVTQESRKLMREMTKRFKAYFNKLPKLKKWAMDDEYAICRYADMVNEQAI